jgi:hypothetical protein
MTGWWFKEHVFFKYFSINIGNGIITPTDETIFFRGVGQPPTRWFSWWWMVQDNFTAESSMFHEAHHGPMKLIPVIFWSSPQTPHVKKNGREAQRLSSFFMFFRRFPKDLPSRKPTMSFWTWYDPDHPWCGFYFQSTSEKRTCSHISQAAPR